MGGLQVAAMPCQAWRLQPAGVDAQIMDPITEEFIKCLPYTYYAHR